jgi:hypothetical protein
MVLWSVSSIAVGSHALEAAGVENAVFVHQGGAFGEFAASIPANNDPNTVPSKVRVLGSPSDDTQGFLRFRAISQSLRWSARAGSSPSSVQENRESPEEPFLLASSGRPSCFFAMLVIILKNSN